MRHAQLTDTTGFVYFGIIMCIVLQFASANTLQSLTPTNRYLQNVQIGPQNFTGAEFSKRSTKVVVQVHCSQLCNIFLIPEEEIPQVRRNLTFVTFTRQIGVLRGILEYDTISAIQNGIAAIVVNSQSTTNIANITLQDFLPPSRDDVTSILPYLIPVGFVTGIIMIIIFVIMMNVVCRAIKTGPRQTKFGINVNLYLFNL
jgi:hypothetical protein